MIKTDLISASCMLILITLFLTERVEIWHLYVMMSIRSAMQAFQHPAAAASTSMLVPESFVPRATGLNQSLYGLMTVTAAPIGALAISIMPIGLALAIDVVTAVLGIVPLPIFPIPQMRKSLGSKTSVWQEFVEGVQTVWSREGLRHIYMLYGAVMLVVMPTFTLMPLLVRNHFAGGATDVAVIEALSGLGMLMAGLAALIAPKRKVLWLLWGFVLSCAVDCRQELTRDCH